MRAVAILGLLAACTGGGLAPVPLSEYGAAGPEALCSWAVRCRYVPDTATCLRLRDPKSYDLRRAAEGVAAGRLRYDADAAAACLDAGRHALCPAPPFADVSCGQIFVGLVAEGGACTTAFDCTTGLACTQIGCSGGCCAGTCQPAVPVQPLPPRGTPGTPCDNHDECVEDAYCDATSHCRQMPSAPGEQCLFGCTYGDLHCDVDTLRCVRYAELGAACGSTPCNPAYAFCADVCQSRPGPDEACDELRICIPGTRCIAGRCQSRGAIGDPCMSNDQCVDACDSASGRCIALPVCP